jgi:hypothetical protein
MPSERRKRVRKEQPTLEELRAVFHRLWTSQVGQPKYSKRDWRELRQMMFRMFKVEV